MPGKDIFIWSNTIVKSCVGGLVSCKRLQSVKVKKLNNSFNV